MPDPGERSHSRASAWMAVGIGVLLVAIVGVLYVWQVNRPSSRPRAEPPQGPSKLLLKAKARGQLRITCDPLGAEISIDGQKTGRYAPDLFDLEATRPHLLRLEFEDYEPFEEELRLEPGEVREIQVSLTPMPP